MEKLTIALMIEILGRPKEHVSEALHTISTKIGAEQGVKILTANYHDPVEIKDSKDLFTAFVELTLELDSLANYFGIIFAYMPSYVEVISPERITLTNQQLNELANKLTQRLHNYDAIAKQMIFERDILIQKIKEGAPHLLKDPNILPATLSGPSQTKQRIKTNTKKDAKKSKKIKRQNKLNKIKRK